MMGTPFYETDAYKVAAYDRLLATLAELTQATADRYTDGRTPTATAVGWEPHRWVAADNEVCLSISLVYNLPEDPAHDAAGQGLIAEGVITIDLEAENHMDTGEWFSRNVREGWPNDTR